MRRSLLIRAYRSLTQGEGITERAVKSGIWAGLINVLDKVLQLGKVIILASLLSPEEFGLMGIALLTLAVFKQLSQLGFDDALIQRKEETVDEFLDTVWSLQTLRGLGIAAITFVSAPAIAAFFDEPAVVDVVRVIGFTPLLRGLRNPGVVYFQKNLEYHKQFVFVLSGSIVSAGVALGYALVSPTVWALALGSIAGVGAKLVASYVIHGYRPWPGIDASFARELFDYSKWLTVRSGLLFLVTQGDDLFVGWMLGATALGFYQLAYRISNAPATEISHVISRVVFPTYSKIQDDTAQLREGFFKTLYLTTFVAFPVTAGIIVVAPTLVEAFWGPTWQPIVLPMQLLAFWGLFRALGSTVGPVFDAVGRPDINTKFQFVKVGFIGFFIYPATAQWGIVGTSAVVMLNTAFTNPVASYLVLQITEGEVTRFLKAILYPGIGCCLMAGGVLLVRQHTQTFSAQAQLVLLVLSGVVLYAIVMLGVWKGFDYELEDTLKTIFGAIR